MLIYQCVASQPEACYPRLYKLERGLVLSMEESLFCISVHESSRTESFVSPLLTLYLVI